MTMNAKILWYRRVTVSVVIVLMTLGFLPTYSAAQGAPKGLLETPQPGSFQSGIGLVRGWVCNATRVDIEVVGRGALPAVYGQLRGDTQSACSGKADNGFSLLVNWNELGEGTHTVRALADNVEFGRAQVIVATLGQPFLLGAQGEFIVQPFPQSGSQTRIRWEESRQAFTLSNGQTPASGGSSPRADAKLEDPRSGSFQSGISAVRGWVCNANLVEIDLDGRIKLPAVYGEARSDTSAACNDNGNNGFSLQVNWNEAGPGPHTLRVLADGVEIGRATFTVVTLGLGSFPTGLVGDFTVTNFPQLGVQTQVQWQQSQQNFVVTGARFAGVSSGLCTSLSGQASDGSSGTADVTWTNPCLLSGNTAVLRMKPKNLASLLDVEGDREARGAANGAFFVCAKNLTIRQGGQTFGASDFRLVDFAGKEVCGDIPLGSQLDFLIQVAAQSELNLNVPFLILYNGQPVVDFRVTPPAGAPQVTVSASELSFSVVPTSAATVTPSFAATETSSDDMSLERDERALSASEDLTFRVSNTGGGTLQGGMTLIASDSGRQAFQIISGSDINLGAGQSQTVTVRFTPLSIESITGSIRIATNGGAKRVLLRGGPQTGAKPAIGASTTSLEFGSVSVNSVTERSFTVTNTGGGTLTGSADVASGGPFSVIAGQSLNLAAGASQTVTVQLAPTTPGRFDNKVILNTNAGTFAVLLGATVVGPQLTVSPGALNFGTTCEPSPGGFSISNTGGGVLSGSIGVSGPFTLSIGSFTLSAGQSVPVTVTWRPSFKGTDTGAASITSNVGSGAVSLSGTCRSATIGLTR